MPFFYEPKENIRCKRNTDHPTHPHYARSSFLFYNLYRSNAIKVRCQKTLDKRYSSCRYNERQLIHVTVVRRVRPRAERSGDTTTH